MKDETVEEWLKGQGYLNGDPSWRKDAWQPAHTAPKGFDAVWLYLDGEVQLCQWDGDLLTGYRWGSCCGLGSFNEKSVQAWKPVHEPKPPTTDELLKLSGV